jgi:PadR family transcriptional regulator PadR
LNTKLDELPDAHLVNRIRQELRRGVLALAVLAALRQEEYGYSLRRKLAEGDFDIEEGTLYPLIRRLEFHGMLLSEWRESDSRKRRYYKISATGTAVLDELMKEWRGMSAALDTLVERSA